MTERSAKVFIGDSRDMSVLEDGSVELVVTSPPYWSIKDYNVEGQIGYGQSLHGYLKDLYRVWKECRRVLSPGRRLCVNIGDQFARATEFTRYRIIPLHSEVISQMEHLGFDFMGDIIWEKRTTMNTTGGAPVMGSFPYPPNGMIEVDYEHIMVFRNGGEAGRFPREIKEASVIPKSEWKELFRSHWRFGGARQVGHEAMFPLELPKRLIRMFSFKGETVLDPFSGSGTTLKAACDLDRLGIGFEVNPEFIPVMEGRFGPDPSMIPDFIKRPPPRIADDLDGYVPSIRDCTHSTPETGNEGAIGTLLKVRDISDDLSLSLSDGSVVGLAGLRIVDEEGALGYLRSRIKGKNVTVERTGDGRSAMVHLKNRIFVNGELIRSDLAIMAEGYDGPSASRLQRISIRSTAPGQRTSQASENLS